MKGNQKGRKSVEGKEILSRAKRSAFGLAMLTLTSFVWCDLIFARSVQHHCLRVGIMGRESAAPSVILPSCQYQASCREQPAPHQPIRKALAGDRHNLTGILYRLQTGTPLLYMVRALLTSWNPAPPPGLPAPLQCARLVGFPPLQPRLAAHKRRRHGARVAAARAGARAPVRVARRRPACGVLFGVGAVEGPRGGTGEMAGVFGGEHDEVGVLGS